MGTHPVLAGDMLTSVLHGVTRKSVESVAQVLALFAIFVLAVGGVTLVMQTIDTNTVATGLNMAFVNGTLPVMAFVVFLKRSQELLATIKKPASEFVVKAKEM